MRPSEAPKDLDGWPDHGRAGMWRGDGLWALRKLRAASSPLWRPPALPPAPLPPCHRTRRRLRFRLRRLPRRQTRRRLRPHLRCRPRRRLCHRMRCRPHRRLRCRPRRRLRHRALAADACASPPRRRPHQHTRFFYAWSAPPRSVAERYAGVYNIKVKSTVTTLFYKPPKKNKKDCYAPHRPPHTHCCMPHIHFVSGSL